MTFVGAGASKRDSVHIASVLVNCGAHSVFTTLMKTKDNSLSAEISK
jgi:hypothetical protein